MEEVIEALKNFGLTKQQAKTYITLIENGEMSAKEVSENAKIPYAKIHKILLNLKSDGWITIEDGKPKMYKAKPPTEVLKEKTERNLEKLRDISRRIVEELQPLYDSVGGREKSEITILRGEKTILERTLKSIVNANKSLEIAIPKGVLKIHREILEELLKLMGRVNIKILIDEETLNEIKNVEIYDVKIGLKGDMFGGGIIIDDDEAIILLSGRLETPLAIWSNNRELIKIAKIYFEHLWRDSKQIN